MYEILEREKRMTSITKEDIIERVSNGESVSIQDSLGNQYNITRFGERHIKIYPLASLKFTTGYLYDGVLMYLVEYDSRWVSKYTINNETLPDLLKSSLM